MEHYTPCSASGGRRGKGETALTGLGNWLGGGGGERGAGGPVFLVCVTE
jgi:hypothetical protein